MQYTQKILEQTIKKNPNEPEFHQAITEILTTLQPFINEHPQYEKEKVLERMVEPERQIIFRVPWVDDKGEIQVNRGYRVQSNSAIGPYKGGLRFHPSVNLSVIKFLSFEQIFKNSLTGLPIGGGKGGADFDPKGKSDREVMAFCQSFINELYRHIGADWDIPAGDIGVGGREIGFMYGQYKRLTGKYEGAFTGKGLTYGGSLVRTEATGYGLVYMAENMLHSKGISFEDKKVAISGSGNVAIYAAQKASQFGAKVVTMSDSNGYVYDPDGMDIDAIKEIKEKRRGRIKEYLEYRKNAEYFENGLVWSVPCDIALPCATQNELQEDGAKLLIKNGCIVVAEGSNMSTSLEATHLLQNSGVFFAPGKAANAGGVAVSALEMAQNSSRISWSFEEIDCKLRNIMHEIYTNSFEAAEKYGMKGNLVAGANIAGFKKVADAMIQQGTV
ncbi:MAG: NADP-specific glutamate dehydrogenase [Oscillospiraceae bacterium]|nr:NADP-specific glutamate dehydrogenase [Oscillospiraceae bacterium]